MWKISSYATDNHLLNYRSYNLPLNNSTAQTDCPRFTERHDWAENWNRNTSGVEQEAITTYAVPSSATIPGTSQTGTLTQVTLPDLTYHRTYFGSASGSPAWQNGLPLLTETYDSGNTKQRWVTPTWTQDDTNVTYPLNPRVTETNIYDPAGNRARTRVDYATFNLPDGTSCRYPQDTYEYQADATTVLRRTHTDYNMAMTYTNLRIIGLASAKYLCDGAQGEVPCNDGSGASLLSKVTFQHDELGSIQGTDAPVQHDTYYSASFLSGRGNLSSVTRHDVVNSGQSTTSTFKYNTAGAVVATIDPLNHGATVSYADSFSDGINRNTLAYPTSVTDADGYSSTAQYNFDFGAVTRKQTPQPNTTANLPGPVQTIAYDSFGRTERVTNLVNNAYTRFEYPASQTRVDTYATIQDNAGEAHSFKITDGHGRVIATAGDHPGSAGGFSGQLIYYDLMGRTVKTSNPTETSAAGANPYDWPATGDDSTANGGFGWVYTQQTYDWKGRPLVTTNTDGTQKYASYGGCGCAGGEVVTPASELVLLPPQSGSGAYSYDRRRQMIFHDVSGRVVKSEILNRDGTPYTSTVREYNTRNQVTAVKEYKGAATADGSCPVGTCQMTTTGYDGYGRLQTEHVPEQNAGTATTYSYNSDDTINSVTDARGAAQTFGYNNRHLVTGITYSAPSGITVPTPVSFGYDAAGNRTSMSDSTGSAAYHFDQLSRMDWEERTFNGLSGTYRLSYGYNLAGQLTGLTEPSQFGASISYAYDQAGSLSSVTGAGFAGGVSQFASNMKYRAWGSLKEMDYGNGLKLNNSFNARLQPTNYQVKVPNTPVGQGERARSDYQYEPDGRIKQAYDLTDGNFNRSYLYDHVGRLVDAHTASAAYFQSFSYDEFGNMTVRGNGSWRYNDTTLMQYANNRNVSTTVYPPGGQPQTTNWVYDFDGNVTNDHNKQYNYDAEGNKRLVFENTGSRALWLYQDYDADGERVKRVEQAQYTYAPSTTVTSYYLRSIVLDDQVIIELDQSGQKRQSYVYANGMTLAQQRDNQVQWVHVDPVTGSLRETGTDGNLGLRSEFDPLGNDAPLFDPAPPEEPTPDYLYGGTYGSNGNPYDGASGCTVDGQPLDCSFAVRLVSMGIAAQCPDNRCGPRHNGSGWDFLRFDDNGMYYDSWKIVYGVIDARTGNSWQKVRRQGRGRKGTQRPQRRTQQPQNGDRRRHHPEPQRFRPVVPLAQQPADQAVSDCRVKAMLDAIAWAEGTTNDPDDGYGRVVRGTVLTAPNNPALVGQVDVTITNLTQHPNILVRVSGGLNSTAAGRYQFLYRTWNGLGLADFGSRNQDIGAVMLLRQGGAMKSIENGNIQQAVSLVSGTWASLPGSPHGQPTVTMADFQNAYNTALTDCLAIPKRIR